LIAEPSTPGPGLPPTTKRGRYFYGWNIVAASIFSNALTTGVYWQGFQVFFLPLLQEFGWSRTVFSLAFSLRSAETGVGAPVVGLLVDRFGSRRVILGSALAVALGMFLVGCTFDILSFYAFFIVASVGASGTSHSVSWSVAVAHWFRRRRGTALGLAMSGPALSGFVLVLMERMVEGLGWRTTVMLAGAALALVLVPIAWFVVRDTPEEMGMTPDGDPAPAAPAAYAAVARAAATGAPPKPRDTENFTVGQALHTKNFWLLIVIFSCIFFGHSAIQVHQIAFFQNDAGLSATDATLLLGLVFAISAIGRVGAGFVSDLVDVRVVLGTMVGLNVGAWCYLTFATIDSFWSASPFALLYGIPFGATVSLRPVLMAKLFGARAMGSLVGLFQLAVLGVTIIGPVFMGWVYDVAGTYRPSLSVFAVSSALALPVVFLMRPHTTVRSA